MIYHIVKYLPQAEREKAGQKWLCLFCLFSIQTFISNHQSLDFDRIE
jgi:hypothetical protein